MDEQPLVRTLAPEIEAQRSGSYEQAESADLSREAVLEHTGEVFEALQQKVKELNAQLDGDGGDGAAAGAGYNGYDSYAEDDAHEAYEQQQAYRRYDAARAAAGQGAETPHGQPAAPQQQQPGYSPEVERCVRQSVAELEAKLEGVLEGVADDLAAEVSREQQHLVLMQSQVDKQGQTLLREIASLQGRLDQERTQRSFVQSAIRDSKDEVSHRLEAQAQELAALRLRLAQLETPWIVRTMGALSSLVWGPCGSAATPAPPRQSPAARNGSYEMMPDPGDVHPQQQQQQQQQQQAEEHPLASPAPPQMTS